MHLWENACVLSQIREEKCNTTNHMFQKIHDANWWGATGATQAGDDAHTKTYALYKI